MKFSEFLKQIKKERKISQESLGFEIDQSPQSVSYMMNDKRFPRIDEVEHIAEVLGYEVVYVKKGQLNE